MSFCGRRASENQANEFDSRSFVIDKNQKMCWGIRRFFNLSMSLENQKLLILWFLETQSSFKDVIIFQKSSFKSIVMLWKMKRIGSLSHPASPRDNMSWECRIRRVDLTVPSSRESKGKVCQVDRGVELFLQIIWEISLAIEGWRRDHKLKRCHHSFVEWQHLRTQSGLAPSSTFRSKQVLKKSEKRGNAKENFGLSKWEIKLQPKRVIKSPLAFKI